MDLIILLWIAENPQVHSCGYFQRDGAGGAHQHHPAGGQLQGGPPPPVPAPHHHPPQLLRVTGRQVR